MSSFHDQVLSEIESARKLAAEFAGRHRGGASSRPRLMGEAERKVQEEMAMAEIAALAAEEDRLAGEARERAELRAIARAEKAGESHGLGTAVKPLATQSRWNATTILNGLAKLRAKEWSAAEELIRKARASRDQGEGGAAVAGIPAEVSESEEPSTPVRGMWMPSLGPAQEWFFTSEGTRCGPVTFAELRTMASSRVLDPRRDMVWKNGMADWKQAGVLDGLFERRSIPATAEVRVATVPKAMAALPTALNAALASKHLNWPGAGRLALWLGLLVFPLLWRQILLWGAPTLVATLGSARMSVIFPWAGLVPVVVLIHLLLMRFTNLGMSRWWALGLAIPILNLWLGFRCLCCPPGHAYHRKLDPATWAITLAILVAAPMVIFVQIKHPGLLTPSGLLSGLHAGIEEFHKLMNPR